MCHQDVSLMSFVMAGVLHPDNLCCMLHCLAAGVVFLTMSCYNNQPSL